MSYLHAIILAIIEGITEFLPVSSTGHIIIGSSLMGISHEQFTKMFTVSVQFGAILAVVVLYFKRFFQSLEFYLKLFVAFLPAAIFGKLLGDYVDLLLDSVITVAVALIAGGIIFLFIDNWFSGKGEEGKRVTYRDALMIGLFQVLAMIPGVSRSAATIIGGMAQKLSRKNAAEFSFFLAVPTIFAASCYKLFEYYNEGNMFGKEEFTLLATGNIVAFIVALAAIKFFIGFFVKYGFKVFGWYRIILGGIIIVFYLAGFKLSLV